MQILDAYADPPIQPPDNEGAQRPVVHAPNGRVTRDGVVGDLDKEACTLNLAPTASTTAQMAMGDALAVALLDALKTLAIPVVECHLSNPAAREAFRKTTYVSLAATGIVSGFGAASYELAIEAAAGLVGAARS